VATRETDGRLLDRLIWGTLGLQLLVLWGQIGGYQTRGALETERRAQHIINAGHVTLRGAGEGVVGSRGGGKGSRAKRQQTQPQSGPHWCQTAGSIQRSLDLGSRSISHDCSSYRRRLELNSIRLRFSRLLLLLDCCSYRIFCASAMGSVRRRHTRETTRLISPILSANHSSRMSLGSQTSRGKFVAFSSTSTNSTSFAYKCGFLNDRFIINESLKCFGAFGSLLREWNWISFAYKKKKNKRTDFIERCDGADLDLRITWSL